MATDAILPAMKKSVLILITICTLTHLIGNQVLYK